MKNIIKIANEIIRKRASIWRDVKVDDDRFVEVYKNPDSSDISFAKRDQGGRAALVDRKDLYVWRYDDAQHSDIVPELPGFRKIPLIITVSNEDLIIQKASWSYSGCIDKSEVENACGIKKLMGNRNLEFFDPSCSTR